MTVGLNKAERLALESGESNNDRFLDDANRTVSIAHEALAISPLVADAYVNLAIHGARGPAERLFYWQAAVTSAELALGKAAFEEFRGSFWGLLETRPFMRGKHGLAIELWDVGRPAEAIGHAEDMLRLNPNDNQGIRYILLDWYIQTEMDKKASTLLRRNKGEDSTFFLWAEALLVFRGHGDSEASRAALLRATASNLHVASYLLGKKKFPAEDPGYYERGAASEAISYARHARKGWISSPGALDWLKSSVTR